jgi:circadian clock protein KaiC
VSSIEHASSERTFRQFTIGIASLLREHGRSALLTQTIAPRSDLDQAAPFLSTIPDAILTLGYRADGPDLPRTVRVLKMRGSAHETRQHALTIDETGISVS